MFARWEPVFGLCAFISVCGILIIASTLRRQVSPGRCFTRQGPPLDLAGFCAAQSDAVINGISGDNPRALLLLEIRQPHHRRRRTEGGAAMGGEVVSSMNQFLMDKDPFVFGLYIVIAVFSLVTLISVCANVRERAKARRSTKGSPAARS